MLEENKLAENKLIILYLLEKMDVSLSNTEISQFVMERNIMDYFSVQKYLSELTDTNFLDAFTEHGSTRYDLTTEGKNALKFFENRISQWLKNAAKDYIVNNRSRIRSEYETSANYFPEINGEYLVKCAVCGIDGAHVMEVVVTVATKNQAQIICTNWKKNVNSIVSNIFASLTSEEEINKKL